MNNLKFGYKEYFKPTPKLLRKLGDTLLACSMFITAFGVIEKLTWLPIASLAIGFIGKFLTNFFTEDLPQSK